MLTWCSKCAFAGNICSYWSILRSFAVNIWSILVFFGGRYLAKPHWLHCIMFLRFWAKIGPKGVKKRGILGQNRAFSSKTIFKLAKTSPKVEFFVNNELRKRLECRPPNFFRVDIFRILGLSISLLEENDVGVFGAILGHLGSFWNI